MPQSKTLPARVKAATDVESADGEGIVEALVATYDIDSAGDQIAPGAFADSLKQWAESGNSIPFIWSHLHDDLDAYLGDVLEAKETDEGLWVRAQLDMDDERARKAYKLLKSGRVSQYSFAYEVLDSAQKGDVLELKQLKLFEVGPTLIGMNQATRTLAVKRSGDVIVKRGRVLSATNEQSLREAHDAIGRVLAQLDSQPDDAEPPADEPSTDQGADVPSDGTEKADERASVKADEPTRADPADDDLSTVINLLSKGVI